MMIELNEIVYTELILSIDVKADSGKVAFNIIKGCKIKDYPDCNGAISRERIKNKYKPVSAPSMMKLEKQFRKLSSKKVQDPGIWITELEDLCLKFGSMESFITENHFMIHILSSLTSDYDSQLIIQHCQSPMIRRTVCFHWRLIDINLRKTAFMTGNFKSQ
jgi:hypothetical protein